MRVHENAAVLGRMCKIHRKLVRNLWKRCDNLWMIADTRVAGTFERPLLLMYLEVEDKVVDIIKYARSQRLPVTNSHVKAFSLREATTLGMSTFKASNCWVFKFLRRSIV